MGVENKKDITAIDILLLAGAIGYFILPADAIPDWIPAFGFADDAAALTFAFRKAFYIFSNANIDAAREKTQQIFGKNFDERAIAELIIDAKKNKKK